MSQSEKALLLYFFFAQQLVPAPEFVLLRLVNVHTILKGQSNHILFSWLVNPFAKSLTLLYKLRN